MNITQQTLAQLTKIHQTTLSNIENGKTNPHRNTLRKIVETLKCSMEYLEGKTDVPVSTAERVEEDDVSYKRIIKFNLPIEFYLKITKNSLLIEVMEKDKDEVSGIHNKIPPRVGADTYKQEECV